MFLFFFLCAALLSCANEISAEKPDALENDGVLKDATGNSDHQNTDQEGKDFEQNGHPCTVDTECSEHWYCQKNQGDCNGKGYCVEIGPYDCTADFKPTCGCDGKSYGNPCDALSRGVNIAYMGHCTDSF